MQAYIKHFLSSLFLICSLALSWGQCDSGLDFEIPDSICTGERFEVSTIGSTGDSIEWDFCGNALQGGETQSSTLGIIPGTHRYLASDYFYKEGTLMALYTSLNGNQLTLLSFDNSTEAFPNVTNFPLATSATRSSLTIFSEKNQTYALSHLTDKNEIHITNITQGNLSNEIVLVSNVGGNTTTSSLSYEKQGDSSFVFLSSFSNNQLHILNFKNSIISNTPIIRKISTTGILANPYALQAFQECGVKYLAIMNLTKDFVIYSFGDSYSNTPTVLHKFSLSNGIPQLSRRFKIIKENNQIFIILLTDKQIHRFQLTNQLTATNLSFQHDLIVSRNNNSALINLITVKEKGKWLFLSIENIVNTLYSTKIHNNCNASILSSTDSSVSVSYHNETEPQHITLNSITKGQRKQKTKVINFKDLRVPQLSIQENENCISVPTSFTPTTDKPITSWHWNFGDNSSSNTQNTSHQYSSTGTYIVSLNVKDDNNCKNSITDTIQIYNKSSPNFTLPTPICTNNEINLLNTSTGETGKIVNWKWTLNDSTNYSSSKDTSVSFYNSGSFKVKLHASIPGCSDSLEKTLTVIQGPEVKFSALEKCYKDSTKFINLSNGDNITGYKWFFGNGDSSSLISPTILYDTADVFNIKLTANNAQGCKNTFDTTYLIHPLPIIDFDNGLSCSNTLTEFYNRTTIIKDTIKSYSWQLNNQVVDTMKDPLIFIKDEGNNFIKLISSSSFGCIDSLTKAISSIKSPNISIQQKEDCFSKPTKFTDNSIDPATITNRKWTIKDIDATSVSSTFNHTFENPGTYTVYLNLSSSTGCTALDSTIISVNPLPQPIFTHSQLCLNDSVNFINTSAIGSGDSIKEARWFFETVGFQKGNNIKVKFNKVGTENIIIELLTKNGCSANTSSFIEIKESTDANFSLDKSIGIAPLTVNATALQNTGQHTWVVAKNDTLKTTSISTTYDTNNTYSLLHTIKNTNGCIDSVSKSIFVGNYLFDIAVTGLGFKDSLDNTYLTVLLKNNSTISINSPSLLIDINNITKLSTTLNTTLLANTSTSVDIPIGIANQSIKSSNYICISIDTTNINDFVKENNTYCMALQESIDITKAVPNPTSGIVNFNIYSPKNQSVTVTLYNTLGEILKEQNIQLSVGNTTVNEDLTQYSNGIYIIDVNSEGQHTNFKISKY